MRAAGWNRTRYCGSGIRRAAALALALVVAAALPACRVAVERARQEFAVERLDEVARLGSAGAAVTIRVRNDSRRSLRLDEVCVDLYLAGGRAAVWQLHEPVRIPRRTTADYRTRWRLECDDPMAYYALERKIRSGQTDRIEAALSVRGRAGVVRVNFLTERMPLSDFLNTFGATLEDLEHFFE